LVEPNSIDLVYLDPPFNSKAIFNVLYETPQNLKETAQRTAFRDTWSWGEEAQAAYMRIQGHGGRLAALVEGLKLTWEKKAITAYMVTMADRLALLHRALKPTGSLYLHCDTTASHYLKLVLDAIFGLDSFRNEIVWQRTSSHNSAKRYGRIHDAILFYTKSKQFTWNPQYTKYSPEQLGRLKKDADGRQYKAENLTAERRDSDSGKFEWRGSKPGPTRGWAYEKEQLEEWWAQGRILKKRDGTPRLDGLKVYFEDMPGKPLQDVWTDLPRVPNVSAERLGFPTQKPVDVLSRIISASSNVGDLVLDPFCGCGTTVEAAEKLKRKWIGVDVSYYSIRLIEKRVHVKFGKSYQVPIEGIPADFATAEALAIRDPYGFQQWIVGELGCQLWNDGKKGADRGIDGEMRFYGGPNKIGRLLVQVKGGGKVTPTQIREFRTVLKDNKADMGIFFCRADETAEMKRDAVTEGFYRLGSTQVPRLQIVTLTEWFAGQRPAMPTPIEFRVQGDRMTPRPARGRKPSPQQPEFSFVVKGGLPTTTGKGQVINPRFVPDDIVREA